MIAVMLLLSYSASANELTEKENGLPVTTEEKTEDVFLFLEAKESFFYTHCRIAKNPTTGKRYYKWCKSVEHGVEKYLKPEQYPPLPYGVVEEPELELLPDPTPRPILPIFLSPSVPMHLQ